MVIRENNPDASIKGTMYRALRERRKEIEVWRLQKDMAPEGSKMAKNSTRGKADQKGASSGTGRRGAIRSGQAQAHAGAGILNCMPTATQGPSGDGGQGQLNQFMSLI